MSQGNNYASDCLRTHQASGRKSIDTSARKFGAKRMNWSNRAGHSWIFPDQSVLIVERGTQRVRVGDE